MRSVFMINSEMDTQTYYFLALILECQRWIDIFSTWENQKYAFLFEALREELDNKEESIFDKEEKEQNGNDWNSNYSELIINSLSY